MTLPQGGKQFLPFCLRPDDRPQTDKCSNRFLLSPHHRRETVKPAARRARRFNGKDDPDIGCKVAILFHKSGLLIIETGFHGIADISFPCLILEMKRSEFPLRMRRESHKGCGAVGGTSRISLDRWNPLPIN